MSTWNFLNWHDVLHQLKQAVAEQAEVLQRLCHSEPISLFVLPVKQLQLDFFVRGQANEVWACPNIVGVEELVPAISDIARTRQQTK